jgi:glyoxylase-like metal-dependent hydrolase (beta-lactamase superfamily II)
VLVDSPRAARPLLDNLAAAGGVALMFLSHRDDVADHDVIARRFGCRRILHAADVGPDTRDVELQWSDPEPVELAPDLTLIPVPGHTRGSAALLYARRYLFTGDHLWGSDDDPQRLEASRSVCWYSWTEQTRSMERLLEHEFEWVLPGHGRRYRADSPAAMRRELERLIVWMKRRG